MLRYQHHVFRPIRVGSSRLQPSCHRLGRICARVGIWRRVREPLAALQRKRASSSAADRNADRTDSSRHQRYCPHPGCSPRHSSIQELSAASRGALRVNCFALLHTYRSAHRGRSGSFRICREKHINSSRFLDLRPSHQHFPSSRCALADCVVGAREEEFNGFPHKLPSCRSLLVL